MKEIIHNYIAFDRPNYIVVSDYLDSIESWQFFDKPDISLHDIGMWHIKYK